MSEWTPEPWAADETMIIRPGWHYGTIATVYDPDDNARRTAIGLANTRRIVAAVNFVAGFSIEWLESQSLKALIGEDRALDQRRIDACVNACAGIPTPTLEEAATDGKVALACWTDLAERLTEAERLIFNIKEELEAGHSHIVQQWLINAGEWLANDAAPPVDERDREGGGRA